MRNPSRAQDHELLRAIQMRKHGYKDADINRCFGKSHGWANKMIKDVIEDDIEFARFWGDEPREVRRAWK